MSDRPEDRKSTLISEEAAEWLVRLGEGNRGVAQRQQYVRWLKQSPAHIAEMLRLSRLDGLLRNAELDGISPGQEETDGEEASNVVDWVSRQTPAEFSPEITQQSVRSGHWKLAASVSAFALVLLLGIVAQFTWLDNKTIETEAGEWRHFTLADGSIARVGPRSRLRVEFSGSQRFVHLARGEAVFQVTKDPARPFLVNAELAVVRAVGTEFGVSRQDDKVIVTVAEGAVAVSQGRRSVALGRERDRPEREPGDDAAEKKEIRSIAVSTGQQVSISREWPVAVQRIDPIRELAWAQGKLIFDGDTTLAQAIEQFNRRNRMQIEVDDPALAGSLVCCIFSADDPESFALSVATKPNIVLVREGQNRLRIVTAIEREVLDSQETID